MLLLTEFHSMKNWNAQDLQYRISSLSLVNACDFVDKNFVESILIQRVH